jgi:hypothetical protein
MRKAFNVFNHGQFNNPSGNFNNSVAGGFGYVTSARDPRIHATRLEVFALSRGLRPCL